jgi:hypothetical protein
VLELHTPDRLVDHLQPLGIEHEPALEQRLHYGDQGLELGCRDDLLRVGDQCPIVGLVVTKRVQVLGELAFIPG